MKLSSFVAFLEEALREKFKECPVCHRDRTQHAVDIRSAPRTITVTVDDTTFIVAIHTARRAHRE